MRAGWPALCYTTRCASQSGLDDRDDLAVLDELHFAVLQGEEREVATLSDILAGMDLCASLADDDRAGREGLPVIGLYAEILRV